VQLDKGIGKQKEIIGNHIALVAKGRAGWRCAIQDEDSTAKTNNEEVNMKKASGKLSLLKRFLDSFRDEDFEELEKKDKEKETADQAVRIKAVKDTYDKWIKDAEEGNLDVSKLPVELKEVKDQKEDGEEEETKETKDALDAMDKRMKDQEEAVVEIKGEISDIKELVEKLVESDNEFKASLDRRIKDAEAEEEKEEVAEEKAAEEETKDSWPEICSRVEILAPGTKIRKPTKDFAKSLRTIKEGALKKAHTNDSVKDIVSPFVKGDISRLTRDAIDAAFIAASELVAQNNNSKLHTGRVGIKDSGIGGAAEAAKAINKRNKEFYGQK
jgi:hypothetical protein